MAAIYTKPQTDFRELLLDLSDVPLDEWVQRESENLDLIFTHASKVLAGTPFPAPKKELAETFQDVATAHKSLSSNGIIIVTNLHSNVEIFCFPHKLKSFYPTSLSKIEKKAEETVTLGFMISTLGRKFNQRTFIRPHAILNAGFVDILHDTGSEALLDEYANLSEIVNHDWFHSILISTINDELNSIPEKAPIKNVDSGQVLLPQYVRKEKSSPTGASYKSILSAWHMHDAYEGWAIRLQREIVRSILSEEDNPLSRSVRRYMDLWREFRDKTAFSKYSTLFKPETDPADYAMKLLAHALYRAVPAGHKLIQESLAGESFLDRRRYKGFFKNLQTRKLRKYAFGKGTAKSPEEYRDLVLSTSGHAIRQAHEDALLALD
jgi:hypothetical protein